MTDPVRDALRECLTALDDWTNTYAAELCDETRVREAFERIHDAGGTLAYIARITQAARRALAAAPVAVPREPTPNMIAAGRLNWSMTLAPPYDGELIRLWRAMYDAAIAQPKEPT